MVLNFVYHRIINLHWFYFFVWLDRIKILNKIQFVELIHTTFTYFYLYFTTFSYSFAKYLPLFDTMVSARVGILMIVDGQLYGFELTDDSTS